MRHLKVKDCYCLSADVLVTVNLVNRTLCLRSLVLNEEDKMTLDLLPR